MIVIVGAGAPEAAHLGKLGLDREIKCNQRDLMFLKKKIIRIGSAGISSLRAVQQKSQNIGLSSMLVSISGV